MYNLLGIITFIGLILLFVGAFANMWFVSIIGWMLWTYGDSYEPVALLSVKELFVRRNCGKR